MPGKIILGVPGQWADRTALIAAIVKANADPKHPRYLGLGPMISDLQTKETFGLEVCEHDERMEEAFRISGQGRLSYDLLAAIGNHTFVIYVLSRDQSVAAARSMLQLGAFLLDAGGLAIKVETAGIAHAPDRWRYYARSGGLLSVHDAFVTMVGGDEFNYTCGMHNLGLPDASLTCDVSTADAPEYLIGFNQFNLLERPALREGDRFSIALGDPVFALSQHDYGYEVDHECNNPHGRWHMTLVKEQLTGQGPWQERSEPIFMAFKHDDPEMLECTRLAQASLPQLIAKFRSEFEFGTFLVKVQVEDRQEHAFLWLRLEDIADGHFHASVFEAPPEFPSLQQGTVLEVAPKDVRDWAQIRHGALVGGYSLRLQRSKVAEKNLKHYDRYSGFSCYAPLDELT